MESPFHLAFPVKNIESTKFFYKEVLGCEIGREDKKWVDFNFFGHQLSAHLKPDELKKTKENPVDGKSVPVRHFGVILPWEKWQLLSKKLIKINTEFIIEPYVRFEGEVGEQATMFFLDPSGNALEFKSFKDSSQVFAK
tara:strand:+ start:138 stop:554 length:417 start_codon:yes stop_codon:yes gene_type:complete